MNRKKKMIIAGAAILAVILIVGGYFFFKNGGSFFYKKEPVKIHLAWPLNGGIISGQIGAILQNKDFLKKNGFDEADVTNFNSDNDLRLALVNGTADAVLTDETTFARILGQGFNAYGIATLGADGKMALVVAANSSANSTKDLKGRKIGVTFGTQEHKQLLDWLTSEGLDVNKDITLVNVPDSVYARGQMINGTLDAIFDSGLSLAESSGSGKYKTLEKADSNSIVVVSADWVEKNPESVKKFQEALKDAIMYLVQNRQQAINWYGDYSKNDKDVIGQASQAEKIFGVKNRSDINLSISADMVSRLNELVNFMVDQKMIQNRVNVEEYIK